MANANSNNTVDNGTTPEATAIVVSREATLQSYERGLEPTSLDAAYKLATVVAATHICGVDTPEDALVRLLTGRELGLTAMQSIAGVYVVDGKPGLYAEVMEALCVQHRDCERWEWVERSDTRAELLVKRRNRPEQRIVWTLDDARRAGLLKEKSNWEKYPRRMLTARCRSEAAGLMFPDATRGLKSREELGDDPDTSHAAPPAMAQHSTQTAHAAQEAAARALKGQIDAVKTPQERAAVRDAIAQAEKTNVLSGAFLHEVKDTYNARFAKKSEPTKTTPATASSTPTAAAAPEQRPMREPGEEG